MIPRLLRSFEHPRMGSQVVIKLAAIVASLLSNKMLKNVMFWNFLYLYGIIWYLWVVGGCSVASGKLCHVPAVSLCGRRLLSKIHKWFVQFSDSMMQKLLFWASQREDRCTHTWMEESLASSSALLVRCTSISSNKKCPRLTERDWETSQSQKKRGETEECEKGRTEWGEKVKSIIMVLVASHW